MESAGGKDRKSYLRGPLHCGATLDFTPKAGISHWIGLRETLNRKPWFLPSNIGLSGFNFPIIQFYVFRPLEFSSITTYPVTGSTFQPWPCSRTNKYIGIMMQYSDDCSTKTSI